MYINDNRISGFFRTKDSEYIIGHIADFGIEEPTNDANKKLVYITKTEDEYSNLGEGFCVNKTSPNAKRMGAIQSCVDGPSCKYVRVAIETDNEFAANILGTSGTSYSVPVQTPLGAVQDMLNRVDYTYSNTFSLRLKCAYIGIWETSNPDPYSALLTNVYTECNQLVTLNNIQKDVLHMITGRPMGGSLAQGGYNYGQANTTYGIARRPRSRSRNR